MSRDLENEDDDALPMYQTGAYGARFFGPWRAQVVSTADPSQRGNIIVMVPEATGEGRQIAAEPAEGGGAAVGLHGHLWLPEEGDCVWVEYVNGDPSYPVWYGGWWGEDEMPSVLQTGYPNRRGWVTASGHYLVFDDREEALGDVFLHHRTGAQLWLKGDGAGALDAAAGKLLVLQEGQSGTAKAIAREGDSVSVGTLSGTVMVSGVPVAVQFIVTPPSGIPGPPGPTASLTNGKITGGSANSMSK